MTIPSSNPYLSRQFSPPPARAKANFHDLPRLAIGGVRSLTDSVSTTTEPAFLTRILNPKATPVAAPQSLPWILNARDEPASPKPASHLLLPAMSTHFADVLAHVDFNGIPAEALPPIRAVFPATFTAPRVQVPTANRHPAASARAPPAFSRAMASSSSGTAYGFTFTYPLPDVVLPQASTSTPREATLTPRAHAGTHIPASTSNYAPKRKTHTRVLHPPADPFPTSRFTHRFPPPLRKAAPPKASAIPGWGWGGGPQGLARRWAWGRAGHVRDDWGLRSSGAGVIWKFEVPERGGVTARESKRGGEMARGGEQKGKAREGAVDVYPDAPPTAGAGEVGRGERVRDIRTHAAPQLQPQFQFLPPAYTHDAWYDAQLYGAPAPTLTGYPPRADVAAVRRVDEGAGATHGTHDPRTHTHRTPAQPSFPPRPLRLAASTSATPQHPSTAAAYPQLAPSALDSLIPMPPRYLGRMAFGGEATTPAGGGLDTHAAPYAHPQPQLHHDDDPRKLLPSAPHTVLMAASAASFHQSGGRGAGGGGEDSWAYGVLRRRRRVGEGAL